MKNISKAIKKFVVKHGAMISSLAFVAVLVSANTDCIIPFYEPEEPQGLERFKR